MQADEETSITDIEIGADGRIYVFGASREVLEMLKEIGFTDKHLQARLDALSQIDTNTKVQPQSLSEDT